MEPKGRKSSCRSVSRVSSDRFVTRMVALSSAGWGEQARQPWAEGPTQAPQTPRWVITGCPASPPTCHRRDLTSAVGLHGLPPAAGSVPQAGRHVLPRLALRRLHRLQLWAAGARSGVPQPQGLLPSTTTPSLCSHPSAPEPQWLPQHQGGTQEANTLPAPLAGKGKHPQGRVPTAWHHSGTGDRQRQVLGSAPRGCRRTTWGGDHL